MPHKHTRREKDESSFNLPPTEIARPLPVTSVSSRKQELSRGNVAKQGSQDGKKNLKRKRAADKKDDAPRAFKKLMAFAGGKKPRPGLDDGTAPVKKKRKAAAEPGTSVKPTKQTEIRQRDVPTIRPGEKLSEFAARVDAALPLGGLVTKTVKNGKDVLGLKVPQTRKEKKMHKLYAQWREEERKIQEKKEEELELAEEQEMENDNLGVKWKLDMEDESARGKKKKKSKYVGEVGGEDDPWEQLKRKRGEGKIGLHDVAKAPPELKLLKPKLLVRGAAVNVQDIPKAAGSLRKREELQGLRDEVIASYRKIGNEKRLVPT